MRRELQVISVVALLGVVVPPLLFLAGKMALSAAPATEGGASSTVNVQSVMLVGTIVWFVITPFWMERQGK